MDATALQVGFGTTPLSFLDIYFINAQLDLFDSLAGSPENFSGHNKSDYCSAFLKRVGDDVYWAHNSWCGFLAQSHTVTYLVGNKHGKNFITQNSYCQRQFGSNMNFGFNGHDICFNETTHRYSQNESRTKGIWLCWRAVAAEMFAESIEDFREHIMLDNTGTA